MASCFLLRCVGAELRLYKVTYVIAALDEAASTVDRFRDGRIMRVTRPVFRKEVIGTHDIFKLSLKRGESTLVSERFVGLCHSAGLKGSTSPWRGRVDARNRRRLSARDSTGQPCEYVFSLCSDRLCGGLQ
jgi:hypothetical protein